MVTLSSSGKPSSSKASPWLDFDAGHIRWEDCDPRSREAIVRHYSAKIKIMALRLKAKLPQSVELSELMSAGSLGLMEALRKFNPDLRIKFETYAENRIKGAMLDELRRMDWFSRGLRQRMRQIENASHEIEQDKGRPPTVEELCEKTGLPEKDVHAGLEMLGNQLTVSLDAVSDSLACSNTGSAHENDPFKSAVLSQLVEKIAHLVEELTPREKLVLSLYYGEELNMRETAEVMDVTEGRVSQLHSQALVKLRKKFKTEFNMESL